MREREWEVLEEEKVTVSNIFIEKGVRNRQRNRASGIEIGAIRRI